MGDELRERCRTVVRWVLAQRGWGLVQDEAVFVEEVLAEVQARLPNNRRPLEKIIEDATVNRYGHVWHAACGAAGTLRQRRAFTELHRYMFSIALYRANHNQRIAEESTQEALIKVWLHLDRVREPGSFARWAGVIVSNAVNQALRRQTEKIGGTNGEITWQAKEIDEADLQPGGAAEGTWPETRGIGDQPGSSPASQKAKITDEIRARIEAAIKACLRSEQQQAVIIGLFFEQKGFKEVADELGTTPQNVYVLKTRALTHLRECEVFLEAVEDLA